MRRGRCCSRQHTVACPCALGRKALYTHVVFLCCLLLCHQMGSHVNVAFRLSISIRSKLLTMALF